ncbi:F-box/LRR-repeat protein 2 [Smittium mucronatum]|uniref:F-box/LRR-repeat protein 2 n=1 Tax=Smittium mucronatum TaxID=133383 RepID=A0A1R0H4Z1_9FUNG|nr:F-box/LRR-repeat protein 2 [Smittium mucronatum]
MLSDASNSVLKRLDWSERASTISNSETITYNRNDRSPIGFFLEWFYSVIPLIYDSPVFGFYWKTPLDSFIKFLSLLKNSNQRLALTPTNSLTLDIRRAVRKLDLTNINYHIYKDIKPDWLYKLITRLPNLEHINMKKFEYVSNDSILFLYNRFSSRSVSHFSCISNAACLNNLDFSPHSHIFQSLKFLGIGSCSNLSAISLQILLSLFTNLSSLSAPNLYCLNDTVLSIISQNLKSLLTLDISRSPNATDIGFIRLSKIPLRNLRVSGCKNISNSSLENLSNFPSLRVFDISLNSKIDYTGFHKLRRRLEIARLDSLHRPFSGSTNLVFSPTTSTTTNTIPIAQSNSSHSFGSMAITALLAHGCNKLVQPLDFSGLYHISQVLPKLSYLTLSYSSLIPKSSDSAAINLNKLGLVLETFENLVSLEIHDINEPVHLDTFLVFANRLPAIKTIKLLVVTASIHQRCGIESSFENGSSSTEPDQSYDSDDSIFRSVPKIKKYLLNKSKVDELNQLSTQIGRNVTFIYIPIDPIEY